MIEKVFDVNERNVKFTRVPETTNYIFLLHGSEQVKINLWAYLLIRYLCVRVREEQVEVKTDCFCAETSDDDYYTFHTRAEKAVNILLL